MKKSIDMSHLMNFQLFTFLEMTLKLTIFQSTCPKVVATFTSSQPRKQSKRLEPFQVMPCCQWQQLHVGYSYVLHCMYNPGIFKHAVHIIK